MRWQSALLRGLVETQCWHLYLSMTYVLNVLNLVKISSMFTLVFKSWSLKVYVLFHPDKQLFSVIFVVNVLDMIIEAKLKLALLIQRQSQSWIIKHSFTDIKNFGAESSLREVKPKTESRYFESDNYRENYSQNLKTWKKTSWVWGHYKEMSKEWQTINILMVKVMNMKLPDITVVEFSEVVEDIFSCMSLSGSSAVRFLITSFFCSVC